MPASSCSSWKPAGAGATTVPDKFPAGLRVLVVDDDPTCLMILEKMLKKCNYEATICSRAKVGLSLLRENKNGHDIVLSDVHMPDMDGFKLLEQIGLEMELPVIMMSADDSKNVVMKGVTHGACDYLIKPVRIEALRNIWQHVVRRRKWKDFEPLANTDDVDAVAVAEEQQNPPEEDGGCSSSGNESQSLKNSKRKKEDGYETEEREESSVKKSRMAWSLDLHQQFVAAVNQLGIDKAVPKKILELMNVQRLTRENVASHLQKYRLYLRRLSGTQNLGSINPSFMGSHDLQPRAPASQLAGSQLTGQSLAKLQSAILHRSNSLKSPISVPGIDQRNVFNFETPKLLHGIPTNMEPKQFMGLNRSYNGVNSQILFPIPGQNQTRIQNQSNINLRNLPRGGNVPNYNYLNEFNDPSSYSSGKKPGFFPEEIGSFHNGFSQVNQDELVSSILKQQQQEAFGLPENEFGFDECLDDDDFPQ